MSVIHHKKLLPLPCIVESEYETIVGPSREVNTHVNRYIPKRATTKGVMMPHLNPKFQG